MSDLTTPPDVPLPEPDCLVECAQSFVSAWTESRLIAYRDALNAAWAEKNGSKIPALFKPIPDKEE